jgi:hypothetical protein
MLVGTRRVLLMDEISTGLDSATLYNNIQALAMATHGLLLNTVISLLQVRGSLGAGCACAGLAVLEHLETKAHLGTKCTTGCHRRLAPAHEQPRPPFPCPKPPPEVFELFDDLLLMSQDGRLLYHGPVGQAVPFFEDKLGFRSVPPQAARQSVHHCPGPRASASQPPSLAPA